MDNQQIFIGMNNLYIWKANEKIYSGCIIFNLGHKMMDVLSAMFKYVYGSICT